MEFKKFLTEADVVYHRGTFRDDVTFLDKQGNPYVLVPSQLPTSGGSKNSADNDNTQSNDTQSDNTQSDNTPPSSNQPVSDDQQSQSKKPPDPKAVYVDVRSGREYKWDAFTRQFIEIR